MRDVYVLATSCTNFGKRPDDSFKDLTREAYLDVLADAGWEKVTPIEQAWFGNCGMGTLGQRNIRGQVCFTPLVRDGLFPERVPLINVEGGCATASMAFHGAWKDVASGDMEVSLAIGVEKTFVQGDSARTLEIFEGLQVFTGKSKTTSENLIWKLSRNLKYLQFSFKNFKIFLEIFVRT